jgi:hypothetical protein
MLCGYATLWLPVEQAFSRSATICGRQDSFDSRGSKTRQLTVDIRFLTDIINNKILIFLLILG